MMSRSTVLATILAAALALPPAARAADQAKSGAGTSDASRASSPQTWAQQYAEQRHESHGSIVLGGSRIKYTAVAGTIMIEDRKSEPGAMMSYVAYFRDGAGPRAQRPITFLYNGGPGSATVWLHMGAFGPKRVVAGNGARGAPAPYPIVDNPDCPLDATDLVFIDAPGTGFGRVGVDIEKLAPDQREKAAKHNEELKKDFYGVDQDGRAFDIFITKFLTKFSRWNSPKFLFGESYGTTRSAVLAADLQSDSGIDLNGIMLLSQIFNFDLSDDEPGAEPGIELPYELSLPTYAATAWYHKKLPDRPASLEAFLATVEHFALTDYADALLQGDQLGAQDKHAIAEKLHEYTGLPVAYIEKANLRVDGGMFEKTLLADQDLTIGRLDTRYASPTLDPLSKEAEYDPQSAALSSAYISTYNEYARNVLGFPRDAKYNPSSDLWQSWDWKHKQPGSTTASTTSTNVMPDLATVMKTNPRLKVMQFGGYYDLATPFFAAEYEMHHLGLPSSLQRNISYDHFETGHMVYVSPEALARLHDDVVKFIEAQSK